MVFFADGEVAIDAECDLKNAHVYCGAVHHRMKFFTALMTLVDIVLNKNSYHQIQLIESDDEKRYNLETFTSINSIQIKLTFTLITYAVATGFLKSTDASRQRLEAKQRPNTIQKTWQYRNLRNVL